MKPGDECASRFFIFVIVGVQRDKQKIKICVGTVEKKLQTQTS
jgi:hypothetical protein